jgi:proteasome lid subunit RPN8/RPN11
MRRRAPRATTADGARAMFILEICSADLDFILRCVRDGVPREVCGLIGGRFTRDGALAGAVLPVRNGAVDPLVRFEMARAEMVRAIMHLRRTGQEVVGIYHSHPTDDAIPSPADIREATWPDVAHLIVGRAQSSAPAVRAWLIRGGQAEPAALHVRP